LYATPKINRSYTAPLSVIASFVFNICLGTVYVWSTFVPALHDLYGLSSVQTSTIFGVINVTSCSSGFIIGYLLKKFSPQRVAALGAATFGLGYFIPSLFHGSFWSLLIGIGLLSGLGTAAGVITPIYVGVKNYPQKRGLVIGFIVSGHSLGSFLIAKASSRFLTAGVDVLHIFGIIGIFSLIILLICAYCIRVVTPSATQSDISSSSQIESSVVPQLSFLCLYALANSFGGFLIIGSLLPIGLEAHLSPAMAVTTIGIFALGNMCGRLSWGAIYDRLCKKAIVLSLVFNFLFIWAFTLSPNTLAFFSIVFGIGFCFGGTFVLYPAHISTLFGEEAIGKLYPAVGVARGLSGISGPLVGGWSVDILGSYTPSLYIAMGIAFVGLAATFFVRDRRIPSGKAESIALSLEL